MKRLFLILLVLLVSLPFWGYPYKVNVTSTLNLRSEPSASSEVLLKLKNGDIVECTVNLNMSEKKSDWVRVDYKGTIGYVKAEYLTLAEEPVSAKKESYKARQWYELLDWKGDGYRWMTYLIGGLVLIMWFECKFIRHLTHNMQVENYRGNVKCAWINGILLTITSCSILVYVMLMGSNSLWFFMPSMVNAWWCIVVNFIIFIYVLVNLLAFFLMTINDVVETAYTTVDFRFGLFAWLGAIVALVIWGIGGYDPIWIYYLIGISQIVQVCIIIFQLGSEKRYLTALAASLLYVLGSVSIVILASCLVFVLVMLAIIAIVLAFILKMETAPGGMLSDKDGVPDPHGSETADGFYEIINQEGKRTRLTHNGGDVYTGGDGYLYHRTGDSFHRF